MCGDARVSGDGAMEMESREREGRAGGGGRRQDAPARVALHVRGEGLLDPLRAHATLARAPQHRRPLRPTTKYMYTVQCAVNRLEQ